LRIEQKSRAAYSQCIAPHVPPARAEIIEMIRRIQSGEGGGEARQALERATGNPDVRIIFDVLELEGMSPDKIFELFFEKK
jgi:hypothetical protein